MTERSGPSSAPPRDPQRGSTGDSSESSDGTAVRPGLAERLQAKLGAAAEEAKAKAAAVTASNAAPAAAARAPRRARLRLTRIDPWSVMKTSFLLSIAFGIVTVVAVTVIMQVIGTAGVFDSINSTVRDILDSQDSADFDIEDYVGASRVIGFTMLVAAVDVILITAMATLAAFLYNMAAALLGGVEVTLAED